MVLGPMVQWFQDPWFNDFRSHGSMVLWLNGFRNIRFSGFKLAVIRPTSPRHLWVLYNRTFLYNATMKNIYIIYDCAVHCAL